MTPSPLPLLQRDEHDAALEELLGEAERHERRGRYDRARETYELALTRTRAGLTPQLAASLCRRTALTSLRTSDYDAALDSIVAALAIADAIGDREERAAALNVLASVYWHRSELARAEHYFAAALEAATLAQNQRLVASASANLGVIANVRGEYSRAERHYRESLVAYRALHIPRDICTALNNLGMLHTDRGDWDEAERAFVEGISLAEREQERSLTAMLRVNYTDVWIQRGDFVRAEREADLARLLAEEIDDGGALGEVYRHFGVIARETGRYRQADGYFDRAEVNAARRQDLLLVAEVARERADSFARQGRMRDTVRALNDAHRIFTQLQASSDLADIARRTGRVESAFLDIVRRWGESIEAKDLYTQGHCVRVANLACATAARLGYDARRLFWFRVGALLHDVGKINIPPEILNKPSKLSPDEWAAMRAHPEVGVQLLSDIDFPDDVVPLVLSHHEKWDGSGYPHALKGESIPLGARILGVADVYDALTTDRSYKRGLPHDEAMALMKRDVGAHFDATVFAAFEGVMRERAGVL